MRCKNCGWQNPESASVCEKCHSKLRNTYNPNRPSATRPGDNRDLGRTPTVMGKATPFAAQPKSSVDFGHNSSLHKPSSNSLESIPATESQSKYPSVCPECGYPLSEGAASCPNCGKRIEMFQQRENQSPQSDQSGQTQNFKGTILSSSPFLFPDDQFSGNTSRGDFSLQPIDENGNPYDEPLLINDGDIIVIGNERFLFNRVSR